MSHPCDEFLTTDQTKIGITVQDWDALRADPAAFDALKKSIGDQAAMILSYAPTDAHPIAIRDFCPRTYVTDRRMLSPARLARLCGRVFDFDGKQLIERPAARLPAHDGPARFGFVVSNGFGLGHVTRMQAMAHGLTPYGTVSMMSFSAGLTRDAFYLPSQQYLKLDAKDGFSYTREAALRFLTHAQPTHVLYDGNNIPDGLLAALADRPHIHLTWVRRGMWQQGTGARFMAGQAMADLVIEPGDLSESYDTGISWQSRHEFCAPGAFLKTRPIRPAQDAPLSRAEVMTEFALNPARRHALIMLGAMQKDEDKTILMNAIEQVRKAGLVPVVAHWPISHEAPPRVQYALVVERMPIARYYDAFDVIISAAGYNSYHELLGSGRPLIFMPQEDEGRDQQLARARYAVDQGWALLCRRADIDRLHECIAQAKPGTGKVNWLEDYAGIAAALGVRAGKPAPLRHWRIAPSAPLLKREYRSWKRGKKLFANTFVLAFDMNFTTFMKKAGKMPRETTIVVTDTVDPVQLRRAGFRYVWVNNPMLTGFGFTRQYLGWLNIWRPKKIRDLSARFG